MDAVEFLKIKNRICKKYGEQENDCCNCPLGNLTGGCRAGVVENQDVTEEELVQIVENWEADQHKTRQSEFLKVFPNASIKYGSLRICPCDIDKDIRCSRRNCIDCQKKYWLAEVE